MFVYFQPNPQQKKTDDCVIRALTKALDCDWRTFLSKTMCGEIFCFVTVTQNTRSRIHVQIAIQ